jgi:transcriptional regulator with XRE-family HTH domain
MQYPGEHEVLTGAQLRAARGLINISVADLAERSGLAINTIRRAEAANGPVRMTTENLMRVMAVLQTSGVILIDASDDQGPGVRLVSPEPLPKQLRRRDKPR